MSRVTDGATLRRERVMSMLSFIELCAGDGAPLVEIQSYMLEKYGMKFGTTGQYLRECQLAGFVKEDQGTFHVTDRLRKFRSL